MIYTLEARQIDSFYKEWTKNLPVFPLPEDTNWTKLPESVGRGGFQRVCVRPGMELLALDAAIEEKYVMQVGVRYPHLELSFSMDGKGCWSVKGSNKEFGLQSGKGNLVFLHDAQVRFELGAERHRHVELRMDVRLWGHLFNKLPWQSSDSFYCSDYEISPELQLVLNQILHCPYTGSIRQYYMEGKAFELIALCWHDEETKEKQEKETAGKLKRTDIDKLYQLKEMLGRMQGEPPGLVELARQVGLNDFKLKAGFKELFGTTVFGYVRAIRMREARQLLEEGRVNVSEAALMVGYSNMSHFASLFRKTYGINPSEFVKKSK